MLLLLSYVAQINEMKKVRYPAAGAHAVCHAVCCILNLAVFSLYAAVLKEHLLT